MIMTLVTGIIGIAMVTIFLGFMVVWVKALPIIIIVVGVLLLLCYDFVQELRGAKDPAG
jgi:drug/metabolite transporter (DMT)-like permease